SRLESDLQCDLTPNAFQCARNNYRSSSSEGAKRKSSSERNPQAIQSPMIRLTQPISSQLSRSNLISRKLATMAYTQRCGGTNLVPISVDFQQFTPANWPSQASGHARFCPRKK